jgi:hypothetical protein
MMANRLSYSGVFADGNAFTCVLNGDAHVQATGTKVGVAANNFRSFDVYKGDGRLLYTIDGWGVYAIYYAE